MPPGVMKHLMRLFPAGHLVISLLFVVCAGALVWFGVRELWGLFDGGAGGGGHGDGPVPRVLNAISMLVVAVATLELAQTIIEEEVQREAHMAAPTRVRRFLSRFMIVLVTALSIETLVAVFEFSRTDPSLLPYAASIGLTAAAMIAGWGVFVKLNRAAEELEPEAMERAKEEDEAIEAQSGRGEP
jgi:hypothetical protein